MAHIILVIVAYILEWKWMSMFCYAPEHGVFHFEISHKPQMVFGISLRWVLHCVDILGFFCCFKDAVFLHLTGTQR